MTIAGAALGLTLAGFDEPSDVHLVDARVPRSPVPRRKRVEGSANDSLARRRLRLLLTGFFDFLRRSAARCPIWREFLADLFPDRPRMLAQRGAPQNSTSGRTSPKETKMQYDGETTENSQAIDSMLFESLNGFVKHLDRQAVTYSSFHMTALGSLIAVTALFSRIPLPWPALVGLGVLGVCLAAQWASVSTSISLQKLCWVRQLREVEARLFSGANGPHIRQEKFFDSLHDKDVRYMDKVFIIRSNARRFRLVPIIALIGALVLTIGQAAYGLLRTP